MPLNSYKFYNNNPSVSALSSQSTLASYSPEDAFAQFGGPYRQAYQGLPSLYPPSLPITKTVVQTGSVPLSIASADHPLHSQVFRFSQSLVPYPQAHADNALRSFGAVLSSVPSTTTPDVQAAPVESSSTVPVKAA